MMKKTSYHKKMCPFINNSFVQRALGHHFPQDFSAQLQSALTTTLSTQPGAEPGKRLESEETTELCEKNNGIYGFKLHKW